MKLWIGWSKEPYTKLVNRWTPASSTKEEVIQHIANMSYDGHKSSAIQEIEIDTFYMIKTLFNCRNLDNWQSIIYQLIEKKDPKITFGERIEGLFK